MLCKKCGKEIKYYEEYEQYYEIYCEDCKKHIQKEIKELSKTIKENPDNADLFYQRGKAKYELKKYKEAFEDFDKAITIKDDIPEYYFYRGVTREHIEIYMNNSTLNDFEKVVALKPKNWIFYYEMAKDIIENCENIADNTDIDIAIRYLDIADKLNIKDWNFYYKTAWFLFSLVQSNRMMDCRLSEKADEYFDKAIALNPNNWDFLETAKEYFWETLDFAYDFSDFSEIEKEAIGYKFIGDMLYNSKNINKANEYYEKAIILNPKNTNLYKEIAIKNYKVKEYKNAVFYFEKYLKFKPGDIEIQYEKKFAEILAK